MNATVHAQEELLQRRRAGTVMNNLYGLSDQAVISATSFVTLLVMARALSASAFGAFALVYMVLLFVNSVQSALVTQPHNVLAAAREDRGYRRFTVATVVVGLLFMMTVVLVLGICGITALRNGGGSATLVVA